MHPQYPSRSDLPWLNKPQDWLRKCEASVGEATLSSILPLSRKYKNWLHQIKEYHSLTWWSFHSNNNNQSFAELTHLLLWVNNKTLSCSNLFICQFRNSSGSVVSVQHISQSSNSYTDVNPGARIYYIDDRTYELVDYDQFYLDIKMKGKLTFTYTLSLSFVYISFFEKSINISIFCRIHFFPLE